jgi:hypothetical protein
VTQKERSQSRSSKEIPSNMRSILVYWAPPIAWMALIYYGSSQPTLPTISDGFLDQLVKYGAHFVEYAVLAVLWYRAIYSRFPHPKIQPLAFLIVVIYALSDEFHQSFVPGRSATWQDVAVDVMGGACALLLWNVFHERWRRSRRAQEESGSES